MAVIMQRYAGKLEYTLPKEREAEIFTDNATITSDMKDAVQAMQQAGVMNGKGGRLFAPKDTATRAEAAAVLRRFVEIVIDRDTAGGWAQNDTGSWLYHEKMCIRDRACCSTPSPCFLMGALSMPTSPCSG